MLDVEGPPWSKRRLAAEGGPGAAGLTRSGRHGRPETFCSGGADPRSFAQEKEGGWVRCIWKSCVEAAEGTDAARHNSVMHLDGRDGVHAACADGRTRVAILAQAASWIPDCAPRMLGKAAQSGSSFLVASGDNFESLFLFGAFVLIAACCLGGLCGCCAGASCTGLLCCFRLRPSCRVCRCRASPAVPLSPQGPQHLRRRREQAASGQKVSPLREGFAITKQD